MITERETRNWFHRSTDGDAQHPNKSASERFRNKGWKREVERERFVKREGGQNAPDSRGDKASLPPNGNTNCRRSMPEYLAEYKKRCSDSQLSPHVDLSKLVNNNLMLGYLDLREELEENEDKETNNIFYNKCPEIQIKLNNVSVTALIDSGSQLNGISEEWFLQNKDSLGRVDILNLSNTNVKGALGTKSKLIRKQVLLEVEIGGYLFDLVFFIIPSLNKDCILGINMLREGECQLDFRHNTLHINNPNYCNRNNNNTTINMNHLALEENKEEIDNIKFQEAVGEITTIDSQHKQQLLNILNKHKEVFREEPGRIHGYEHELRINDKTPFFQKGWPIPLAYQDKVDDEIKKMIRFGVIERANSQYINPLVTIIKKDQSVRLCLDA
jgi:hypothetical protein